MLSSYYSVDFLPFSPNFTVPQNTCVLSTCCAFIYQTSRRARMCAFAASYRPVLLSWCVCVCVCAYFCFVNVKWSNGATENNQSNIYIWSTSFNEISYEFSLCVDVLMNGCVPTDVQSTCHMFFRRFTILDLFRMSHENKINSIANQVFCFLPLLFELKWNKLATFSRQIFINLFESEWWADS